jgi:hypothetical protein
MTNTPTTTEERWELPESLQIALNPELLKKADAKQEEWKRTATSPYGSSSPQEFERLRAARQVDELRAALKGVEKDIHRLAISDPQGLIADYERARINLASQLAENLAIIGRFDEAARIHPNAEIRADYLSIMEAVLRDDEDDCGHDTPGQRTRKFVEADVWSIKHESVMQLLRCAFVMDDRSTCGFRNVRKITEELAKGREARAKARGLAGGRAPEEAKSALLSAGHTTAKVLR